MACRNQMDRVDSFVTVSSAAMAMASNSAAIGFVFSLVIHILFHVPDVTRESAARKIRSIFWRSSEDDDDRVASAPAAAAVYRSRLGHLNSRMNALDLQKCDGFLLLNGVSSHICI